MKEISRRKNIDFDELTYYITPEIIELLEKNKKTNSKQRINGFIEYYYEKENKIELLAGKQAEEFMKPYLEVKVEKGINEIKGLVVSSGKKVQGKVKILTAQKDFSKMEKGDILVAPMTSPDFIVAMRKAIAIVTDEGGMTCHAAIVSRELGIPCIVATGIATKVLKDNDTVEVDANYGIVRILESKNTIKT